MIKTMIKTNGDNLKLWKQVSTTPPEHIKNASISGQSRTTVKAIFQKEKATEIFGIQGQQWGVVVGSEVYERIPMESGEIMLQYTATLFYVYDDQRGELPIAAAIMEAAVVKRGKPDQYMRIDSEAIKKVRTDAMTKGLSELGFNADIFKGYYDTVGYSEYASNVTSEAQQEKIEAEAINEAEEYANWKEKALDVYRSLTTVKAVQTMFTSHVRKATKVGDNHGIKEFDKAHKARIEEIKEAAKKAKEGEANE